MEPEFIIKFIGRLVHSVRHEDELLTFTKLTERERGRCKKFDSNSNSRTPDVVHGFTAKTVCRYMAVGLVGPLAACSGKTKQNSRNRNFINEFCESCERDFVNALIT